MNDCPAELKYSETHEWVRLDDDGKHVYIGITDHAQSQLGELVFVELPSIDTDVDVGDDVCVVESVKAAEDIYSPVAGHITAINEDLVDAPGLVNSDPYGDGWLYKIKLKDMQDYEELLSAKDYLDTIED